tara:strand:- start:251 stop:433 length:183 start_codon:yes stop_codon:yes gene_type:complete
MVKTPIAIPRHEYIANNPDPLRIRKTPLKKCPIPLKIFNSYLLFLNYQGYSAYTKLNSNF